HDDVVDQGNVRRGVPAARIVYGNAASVLVGDFLMARALELVVEHGSRRLMDRLCATIMEMAEGEVLQLVRSGEATLSMDNYHRIIAAKTAGLFSWCCAAGAERAGASAEVVENAASLGRAFGMAFQVTDDVLDYVSGPETSGKDLANDLQQGKMTLPLLVACELDPGLLRLVKEVCAEGPSESKCSLIVSRVLASGSIERCIQMAQGHVETVGEVLRRFPRGRESEAIQRLARQILHRVS
ncbi:MAG: polyprenyl synthetase family protein, partial [Deltaproteobacteria bacterium]